MARDFYPLGIVQKLLRDAGDFRCHRGREKQGLAGKWREFKDAFDIGNKAHVEHTVGLVDHHDLNAGQHQFAAFKMVKQPPRCGDQHVNAPVDQAVLILEADTADKQCHGQFGVFGVNFEILGDLCCQLAGRGQNQGSRHARSGASLA